MNLSKGTEREETGTSPKGQRETSKGQSEVNDTDTAPKKQTFKRQTPRHRDRIDHAKMGKKTSTIHIDVKDTES